MTLKYLLSGLIRCGNCNSSLRPLPSGRRSKSGRRYVYYVCPRHHEGSCPNNCHLPEDRLRTAVIVHLRAKLFPISNPSVPPAWLPVLLQLIHDESKGYRANEPDHAAAAKEEAQQLEEQLAGWSLSLANPRLPMSVRGEIEVRYAEAKQRQAELSHAAAARAARSKQADDRIDPKTVIDVLQHLDQVLANFNPTLGNLELSKHIQTIVCHANGLIAMHGTQLGLFAGATELLRRSAQGVVSIDGQSIASKPVLPRHRRRRGVSKLTAEPRRRSAPVPAAEDNRGIGTIANLADWTDAMEIEEKGFWAKDHAAEVAHLRAAGKTQEELAAHFRVSIPTVRKALRLALENNPSLRLPRKLRRACWARDHAAEVVRLRAEGLSMREIGQRVGKSEPTIRAALEYAQRARRDSPLH